MEKINATKISIKLTNHRLGAFDYGSIIKQLRSVVGNFTDEGFPVENLQGSSFITFILAFPLSTRLSLIPFSSLYSLSTAKLLTVFLAEIPITFNYNH